MKKPLFKVYTGFYQRHYRNPEREDLRLMSEMVHDTIKDLHSNVNDPEVFAACIRKARIMAKELMQMERDMGFRIILSEHLIDSLRSQRIDLGIPYQVLHRWNSDSKTGHVYVMTADSRPNECKLGATTISINKRMYFYKLRYGYDLSEYYSKKFTSPFRVEAHIAKLMASHRISGNTSGESNEWYRCNPQLLRDAIKSFKV